MKNLFKRLWRFLFWRKPPCIKKCLADARTISMDEQIMCLYPKVDDSLVEFLESVGKEDEGR